MPPDNRGGGEDSAPGSDGGAGVAIDGAASRVSIESTFSESLSVAAADVGLLGVAGFDGNREGGGGSLLGERPGAAAKPALFAAPSLESESVDCCDCDCCAGLPGGFGGRAPIRGEASAAGGGAPGRFAGGGIAIDGAADRVSIDSFWETADADFGELGSALGFGGGGHRPAGGAERGGGPGGGAAIEKVGRFCANASLYAKYYYINSDYEQEFVT